MSFLNWIISLFKKKEIIAQPIEEKKPENIVELDPAWLTIAQGELGTLEKIQGVQNQKVNEYFKATDYTPSVGDPWCSAFVNWCIKGAGLKGTGKANARSWTFYGQRLIKPKRGCLTVFWRESKDSEKGHVAFYISSDENFVTVLGGNQNDSVCIKKYPKAQLLAYRWPIELVNATTPAS